MNPQYQTLEFVQNDEVSISFTHTDSDGAAVDITGFTILLVIQPPRGVTGSVITKTATLTNPAAGIATFTILSTDLTLVGVCDAQLRVTDTDGNTRSYRNFGIRVFAKIT